MSTSNPVSLPLGAQSCTLEPAQLRDQLERYRQLGRHTIGLQQQQGQLVAQFSQAVRAGLVEQTVEIERGCCSFLDIAYDRLDRRLTVIADGADQDATLAALFSALSPPSGSRLAEALQSSEPDRASIGSRPREPGQCCEPAALETCCEPSAKVACCATPTATEPPARCKCSP
jgi:hypothetical protein